MKRGVRLWACLMAALLMILSLISCDGGKKEPPPTSQALIWALGTALPSANAFFDELPEGATVEYAEEDPFGSLQLGENLISVRYVAPNGKKQTVSVSLTLIDDQTPPVIVGAKDIISYIGEGISYRTGVTVTDNCHGEVSLTWDSVAVDTMTEGVYPVIYWATDAAGNVSTAEVKVHIYAVEITQQMLFEVIDPIINDLGLLSMDREAQVRAIYRFTHTDAHITYVDTSDKTSWVREAYLCLQDRKGDCFSYFAVAKAFFVRLGIPNLDVQRLPGYTDDTHYWSMVDIGDANASRWYHFDACRLRDVPYEGSLLTDRQVDAFSRMRANFYLYDRAAYPATDTREIISRPDLIPYYTS